MTGDPTPRWQYRFQNYSRAFGLLREAVEIGKERPLSQLEKEGVIQRFEYTMELGWKMMRDYLESQGIIFDQVTPRSVIREAFAARLIDDGQVWMDALDDRNRMSHTYNVAEFERVVVGIAGQYLPVLERLHVRLLAEAARTTSGS